MEGQQPGKKAQRHSTGSYPPSATSESHPRKDGVAPDNFSKCGNGVEQEDTHPTSVDILIKSKQIEFARVEVVR